jgi:tetratricopeptide (TPR) repeat protein
MTKRLAFVLATILCLLLVVSFHVPVSAKDSWTSVRSRNFLLVGNASEKDIRQVGVRLEQFREVFSRLFTTMNVNSPVPTTVVVFKNDESYRPFKINANTAGYFQSGPDVNYITLKIATDSRSDQDAFNIIFHEYTHLLVKNTSGTMPTWFNEGLAEYYSTFSITDDQKVVMGRPIASHVFLLRESRMLPLRTLFQVDQNSPHYNERDKQSIFYAESWALMHYLILGKEGQRMPQMAKFVELLTASVPMEQAFQQAFAMSFENMEKELRAYIERDRYPTLTGNFTNKVAYDATTQSAPLTEAEAQAYLGDLMLHSNRAEAESYLQKALALAPDLAMANASLGMLRVRQGRSDEARKSLERAVAASSQNYLIHYYYAYALSREGNPDMGTVMGFAPETASLMRAELKRAIQLRPDFPESYSLLAFVNLVTGTELDETVALLKHALGGSPGRNDLVFMLAQLYMRKEDFKTVRQLIAKLSSDNDAEMRQRAQSLLAQLVSVEGQLARIQAMKEESESRGTSTPRGSSAAGTSDALVDNYDPTAALRESLRHPGAGETQAQGKLTRIDCDAKAITFVVRINERQIKLSTDTFQHVDLMSFSENAGREVTCGLRKPEDNVVVCYLPANDPRAKTAGVIKSIEFVPADFRLQAGP